MDTSFDAAQTQPPFGPGELERWFASFDSFTAKKGHHSALSLFAVRFGNKGFPKFSDPEWLGLVRARQAGIQAEASLKETPARSRAIRRQHTKVAREGELAAELIAAGVVCLIVKESRLIAEQAYKTAAGQHLDDLIQEGLEGLEETVQRHQLGPQVLRVLPKGTPCQAPELHRQEHHRHRRAAIVMGQGTAHRHSRKGPFGDRNGPPANH